MYLIYTCPDGQHLSVESAYGARQAGTVLNLKESLEGPAAQVGLTPPAGPEFTAAAFADYTFPEGGLLHGFGFGFGIRHAGKSYADAANRLVVPRATVFDAALHYQLGKLRLAANVSNVFETEYVAACPAAGTCYAASLRRATISSAYRFGRTR